MIVKRIDDSVIILAISTMAIIMVISTYNTTFAFPPHCDKKGWPSCYSIGYQAALDDSKAGNADVNCSEQHSANFCNGYSDGWQSAHNNNSNNNQAQEQRQSQSNSQNQKQISPNINKNYQNFNPTIIIQPNTSSNSNSTSGSASGSTSNSAPGN